MARFDIMNPVQTQAYTATIRDASSVAVDLTEKPSTFDGNTSVAGEDLTHSLAVQRSIESADDQTEPCIGQLDSK